MSELTKDMVERRLDQVASGFFKPEISGLTGLVFIKMGLKERGKSSRAYSSKLKELLNEGGYFSEALLPTALKKICDDNGLDVGVLKKSRDLMKHFYKEIPDHLTGSYDELTDEEVALLPQEEKTERQKEIQARGREIIEYLQNYFTEDEQKVIDQAKQVQALEEHLKVNTAEHFARKHQMEIEILLCARSEDDIQIPYFKSQEEIQGLGDINKNGLVQLYLKWKQFKEGMYPQFFRPNNLPE